MHKLQKIERGLISPLIFCNLSSSLSLWVAPQRCPYLSETAANIQLFFKTSDILQKKIFFFACIVFF